MADDAASLAYLRIACCSAAVVDLLVEDDLEELVGLVVAAEHVVLGDIRGAEQPVELGC